MRFETTFFPLRTSTTSSMGISTRPILSCRLNAATRLSRLSLTFFSKPEYVWMMYHCIPINLQSPLNAKPLENVGHAELHQLVHHRQKRAEECHRCDHNPGRRNHVFTARPGNLFHLYAEFSSSLFPCPYNNKRSPLNEPISLPCAPCACGRNYRTSSFPAARCASSYFLSLYSCGFCNRRTAT